MKDNDNPIHIALFAEIEYGKISGPSNSVTMLAKSLNNMGIVCDVYSILNKDKYLEVNGIEIHHLSSFYKNFARYDLCVLEGAFRPKMWAIALFCKFNMIKFLVSPRSNLMRPAFKKAIFKKVLALPIVISYLKISNGIHFLSNEERNNSFHFGVKSFVAKNGISFNLESSNAELFAKRNIKEAVFIGRFDIYHKGLDILTNYINDNKKMLRENDFHFSLYGPDYRGGKKIIKDYISNNSLEDLISVNQPLFGVEKERVLSRGGFFIHLSRYEGQPQAVLEAIKFGCVPIVTDGCNMNEVIEKLNYGIIFDSNTCFQEMLCISHKDYFNYQSKINFEKDYSWLEAALEFKKIITEVLKRD